MKGEGPFDAAEFGLLLTTVANDYRISTGRVLAVSAVGEGSLIAKLADAAFAGAAPEEAESLAGATLAAKKYADDVRRALAAARNGKDFKKGRRRPGERTVEQMIQTAVKLEHTVELTTTTPDDGSVKIELSLVEARRIEENREFANQIVMLEPPPALEPPRKMISSDVRELSEVVRSAYQTGGGENISAILHTVASTLKSYGMGSVIGQIANDLESQGLFEVAQIWRQEAGLGQPNNPIAN